MGTTIEIETHRSHPPSVADEEEELHDTGVQVSPHVSPQYSERGGESSHDGSSELRAEEFIRIGHLHYPNEVHDRDIGPSDSASRLDGHTQVRANIFRSASSHRGVHSQRPPDPGLHRAGSDDDSTVEFIRTGDGRGMPRDRQYWGNGAYTQSSSSGGGSYGFPANQMVHYAPQQMAPPMAPYPPQYPPMSPPATMYPQSHPGFAPYQPHPASQMASPYSPSPYGMMPSAYGMPAGYFPPQYSHPQFPPQHFPHPQFMDQWRVSSPHIPPAHPAPPTSPPPAVVPPSDAEKKVDPDEIAKKIEAIVLAQSEKESAERLARDAERAAATQAVADAAAAKAERAASDKRIREEAAAAALKAAEDARKAEAERTVREQQIREEAAKQALAAAEAEAKAKAEKAIADAKIAENAAQAAKTEAEKQAAETAAKLKEESEKKQAEAEAKLKEAEEAAAKAKAEAEAAKKAAEAAKPPDEKKPPIRFHDAVGRKFNFPFELCSRWRGMETLINQAFQHVEVIGEHVRDGHYDLVGPTGEIILPSLWEAIIEPDWQITMHMWPMPEPEKKDEGPAMVIPPPPDLGGMMSMDDILGTGGKGRDRAKGSKKSKPKSGWAAWMAGGSSTSRTKSKR